MVLPTVLIGNGSTHGSRNYICSTVDPNTLRTRPPTKAVPASIMHKHFVACPVEIFKIAPIATAVWILCIDKDTISYVFWHLQKRHRIMCLLRGSQEATPGRNVITNTLANRTIDLCLIYRLGNQHLYRHVFLGNTTTIAMITGLV